MESGEWRMENGEWRMENIRSMIKIRTRRCSRKERMQVGKI